MLGTALGLCGLGLGLSLPALTEASLGGPSLSSSGTWSVGIRHAGLVLGLVLLTPLLAADLSGVEDRARLAGAGRSPSLRATPPRWRRARRWPC